MLKTSLKRQRSTTSPPIVKAKKEDDFCSNIAVIPQFNETCWFNAILMAAFYSQQSRLLIKFTSKSWTPETITDIKKYKLLMIFKSIVFKYYKDPEAYKNLYSKIKPEIILFYLLELNKTKKQLTGLITKMKKDNMDLSWHPFYINKFYKFLGVKCLDIIIFDNKLYYTLKNDLIKRDIKADPSIKIKAIIDANPDVLVIIKNIPYETLYNKTNTKLYDPYLSTNYKYKHNFNALDIKNEITFNGYTYKLDSCLLSNFNRDKGGHVVAGITCRDNKYVYNGWNDETLDEGIKEPIIKSDTKQCSLFKYDWTSKTITEDFCFNTNECKLSSNFNSEDLCFSFNKGSKVYVYVKTVSTTSQNSSKITTINRFTTPSINISSAIRTVFSVNKLSKEDYLSLFKDIYEKYIETLENFKFYTSIPIIIKSFDKLKYNEHFITELSVEELKKLYVDYLKYTYIDNKIKFIKIIHDTYINNYIIELKKMLKLLIEKIPISEFSKKIPNLDSLIDFLKRTYSSISITTISLTLLTSINNDISLSYNELFKIYPQLKSIIYYGIDFFKYL